MRHIEKGDSPTELVDHLRTPGVSYSAGTGKSVKDAIRRDAARDQYGLCCYCCKRLADKLQYQQIEHFEPQSLAAERSLDWKNLLVSCSSGRPDFLPADRRDLTCGDHKGPDRMSVSPLDASCESHFRYVPETGAIIGIDDAGKAAITTLNLNTPRLKDGRKEAMSEAEEILRTMDRSEWSTLFLNPHRGILPDFEPAIRGLPARFNL